MPISSRQFVSSTLALLAIGFVALFAIVATNIWLGERARVYSKDVIAARDVKALAVDLRSALQTAESSQRGYLYTNNEVYLAPYDQAKRQATAIAVDLPGALAAYPDLKPAITRLDASIAQKIAEMEQLIQLKQGRDDTGALALVRTNRGKFLMDEINLLLTGVVLAADRRLADLVAAQTDNALLLRLVSAVGGAVILGAASLAIFAIVRYTRELNIARGELALSNDRLEQRVVARTEELASANEKMREARDRATTLLSEVNHRVANSLALVVSLISIQMRSLKSDAAKSALEEARARVQAIAMVHKRLYADGDVQEVALDEYLAGLLEQFRTTVGSEDGIALRYDFAPLRLKTDASINLGIVLTEWVLNAFKYAYPEKTGEIRVVLTRNGDDFAVLRVEDDGIGRVEEASPKGTGVGTRIVNAMAASMGATVEYFAGSPGTSAQFSFPLAPENR